MEGMDGMNASKGSLEEGGDSCTNVTVVGYVDDKPSLDLSGDLSVVHQGLRNGEASNSYDVGLCWNSRFHFEEA
ncbi:hypothetical protein ACOSP7_002020 [Xanthoceras sorbifolium]